MSTDLTGARWYFSAAHHDEVRKEIHGHSYEVWAFWPASPPRDQLVLQETLKRVLGDGFDHRTLAPEMGTMESLAAAIGGVLEGCVRVVLLRPVEGLCKTWSGPERRNTYRHDFQATCPNNGATISYSLEIGTQKVIMVEDIVAACAEMTEGFHETIADHLSSNLGGLQVLRAHHHGVNIETIRGG